jgi:hypothetical protein
VKDTHSAVLGRTLIPAGADLHGLIAAAIRERHADGWTVENDGSYGFLFCHKVGVRCMVAIVQVDPAEPVAGALFAAAPYAGTGSEHERQASTCHDIREFYYSR